MHLGSPNGLGAHEAAAGQEEAAYGRHGWQERAVVGRFVLARRASGCEGLQRGTVVPCAARRTRAAGDAATHARGGADEELHTKTDKHVQHKSVRRIPAAALVLVRKYLVLSGHSDGWLFRSIRGGGAAARSTDKPMLASTLSNVVKACATTLRASTPPVHTYAGSGRMWLSARRASGPGTGTNSG